MDFISFFLDLWRLDCHLFWPCTPTTFLLFTSLIFVTLNLDSINHLHLPTTKEIGADTFWLNIICNEPLHSTSTDSFIEKQGWSSHSVQCRPCVQGRTESYASWCYSRCGGFELIGTDSLLYQYLDLIQSELTFHNQEMFKGYLDATLTACFAGNPALLVTLLGNS